MVRTRKPATRKPLAPKDTNVSHHPHQPRHNAAAKQMLVDANHREADRRVAAIKAVCDAEVEGYLTQLRVALSMLSKDVRAMPLMEFVPKFCPDRELVRAADSSIVELRPKSPKSTHPEYFGASNILELHSQAFQPQNSQVVPAHHGFPCNTSVGRLSMQIASNAVHEESEDQEFLKFMECFRSSKFCHSNAKTPAAQCDQLVVGMTPKTMRVPKTGEALLSVNGSPLGVYEKDAMPSIREEHPRRARRRLRASGC